MFTLTKWIAAPVAAIGLMFAADSKTAEAQYGYGCYPSSGFSISIGSGYGYRPSVGLYRSTYGHSHLNRYHALYSGRWDYGPRRVYRPSHHFHVPRRYDLHGDRYHHHHHHR